MAKKIPLLENPYRRRGRWFKGAFHFHSKNSDGAISPREAVSRYVSRGYRVIGLSDHSCATRLPAEWFPGRLLVPTAEISWPHLLHIGTPASGKMKHEKIGYALARARREGGFVVLCHPVWSNCSWKDSWSAWPVHAVEIYNHLCEIENATGYSVERWDMLLMSGRRLWGFATDDTHFRDAYPQFDGGWVMIRSPRLDWPDILRSLKAGSFYSSQGPRLYDLKTRRGVIRLRCSPAVELRAFADGVGSGLVYFSRRPRSSWTVRYRDWWTPPRRYVRIEIRDRRGLTAWTNPLYVRRRRGK